MLCNMMLSGHFLVVFIYKKKKKVVLMPCQSNRLVYFCLLVCNILVHTTVL